MKLTLKSRYAEKLFAVVVVSIMLLLIGFTSTERTDESSDDIEKRIAAVAMLKRLAIHVQQYSEKQHKLPQHLSELVPDLLRELPLDPYGKPYRIVSNGPDRLFLYYYGKDGIPKGYVERDMDIAIRIERREGKTLVVSE